MCLYVLRSRTQDKVTFNRLVDEPYLAGHQDGFAFRLYSHPQRLSDAEGRYNGEQKNCGLKERCRAVQPSMT